MTGRDLELMFRRIAGFFAAFAGFGTFVLYTLGWLFVSTLYGQFGIDPADVGIDLEWVLVRATAAAIALTLAATVIVTIPLLDNVNNAKKLSIWLAWSMTVLTVGLDAILLTFSNLTVFWCLAIGLPLSAMIISLTYLGLRLWWHRIARLPISSGQSWLASTLIVLAISLIAMPWLGSRVLAKDIRGGLATKVDFGIGVSIISFEHLKLNTPQINGIPSTNVCVTLLGQHDGIYYLYFPNTSATLRISAENATLRTDANC